MLAHIHLLSLLVSVLCSEQWPNIAKDSLRLNDTAQSYTVQEGQLKVLPLEILANIVRFLDLKSAHEFLSISQRHGEVGNSHDFARKIYQILQEALRNRFLMGEHRTMAMFTARALTTIEHSTPEGDTINRHIIDLPSFAFVLGVYPISNWLPRSRRSLTSHLTLHLCEFDIVFISSLNFELRMNIVSYDGPFGVRFSKNPSAPHVEIVSRVHLPLISYGSAPSIFKALFHLISTRKPNVLVPLEEELCKDAVLRRKLLGSILHLVIGFRLIKHGFFEINGRAEKVSNFLLYNVGLFASTIVSILKIGEDAMFDECNISVKKLEVMLMEELPLEEELHLIYSVLSCCSCCSCSGLVDVFIPVSLLLLEDLNTSLSLAPLRSKLHELSGNPALSEHFFKSSFKVAEFYDEVAGGRAGLISPLESWQTAIMQSSLIYNWCKADAIIVIWDLVTDSRTEAEVIRRTFEETYSGDKFNLDLLKHILSTFSNASEMRALCYQFNTENGFYAFLLLIKNCLKSQVLVASEPFKAILQMFELHGLVDGDYLDGMTGSTSKSIKCLLDTVSLRLASIL